MKAVRIGIPNQVVGDVGNVLDWAVMRGKGIDKQVMAKILQNQKRAFDEGIVVRQILIVPDELSLERRKMNDESQEREDGAANPGALQERAYPAEARVISSGGGRSSEEGGVHFVRLSSLGVAFHSLSTRASFRCRKDALHC